MCVDSGETKKTCVAEFLKCLIGKEEGETLTVSTYAKCKDLSRDTNFCNELEIKECK